MHQRKSVVDMTRSWRMAVWLIALAVAAGPLAAGDQKKPRGKAQQQPSNPQQGQPAQAAPQGQGPALPDAYKLNLLIRASIIALNQANQTGNYTVLQDLGAPAFRASNNSARLAQIFAALRQRQLDLSPVLFFTPKLVAEPQIAPNGLLRLVGFFPTAPERVNFELIYQQIGGQWRLFGIGVNTSPVELTSAIPPTGAGEQAPGTSPAQAAQTVPTAAPGAPENAAVRETQAPPPTAAQKPEGAARPARKSQAETRAVRRSKTARQMMRPELLSRTARRTMPRGSIWPIRTRRPPAPIPRRRSNRRLGQASLSATTD